MWNVISLKNTISLLFLFSLLSEASAFEVEVIQTGPAFPQGGNIPLAGLGAIANEFISKLPSNFS